MPGLYAGADELTSLFLGSTELVELYRGSDLIFRKAATPPVAPTSITLTDTSACVFGEASPGYSVLVEWTNGDPTAETRIYRGGSLIHTSPAGDVNWTDPGPSTGSNGYEVRHYKDGLESSGNPSDSVTVSTLQCSPTGAPSAIVATDASSCSSCTSTYQAHIVVTLTDTLAYTRIYRGGVLVHTLDPGVSTWDEIGGTLAADTYTYEARHYRNGVETSASNPSDAVTLVDPCHVPSAPTLTATPTGTTSIEISSSIPPTEVVSITVYRAGTSTVVGTLNSGNSWTITDSGRSANTSYSYEGEATSDTGCSSSRSSSVSATTWPTTPLVFSATRISDTQVDMTWSVGTRTGTSMEIQRHDGTWSSTILTPPAGDESASDTSSTATTDEMRIRFSGETTWATTAVAT